MSLSLWHVTLPSVREMAEEQARRYALAFVVDETVSGPDVIRYDPVARTISVHPDAFRMPYGVASSVGWSNRFVRGEQCE